MSGSEEQSTKYLWKSIVIPGQSNSDVWVSYEFNSFFAHPTNGSITYIRTLTSRHVTDASICAYAYDFPFDPTKPDDVPYFPHRRGINVLYCDWHVSWLAAELSTEWTSLTEEQFYGKGDL